MPTGWSQAILWTFDSSTAGWGADGYAAGGLSGFAPVTNATQSPIYNPSLFGTGSANFSGLLGPTAANSTTAATWSRAHPGYNATGWFTVWGQDPATYNAIVFDYNMPANTPTDSKGGLPTFTVWLQFGAGASNPNANNSGGSVPFQYTGIADGQWHTGVIMANQLTVNNNDGLGNVTEGNTFTENLLYLHDFTIGMSDGNYTANTTVSADIDNLGFATIVPEPASLAMLGMGFAALGLTVRRKLFRS